MKTIFRIAKTELRTLFYSPIAWFIMIVFLIQCGITYLDQIESLARMQEIGGAGLKFLVHLTDRVYASRRGLFVNIMQKLYLFIPLLTMGLISREINNGTIKLLYSSPVKVREIIFGKYLAMMVYSLLLVAVISIFLFAGMSHIVHADGGMLLSSVLGFYLLLCAYSAVGLFMSCLTTYQIVAAVCTFMMIGILSYIGTLWQDIDFVRDLTYYLSLNGRAEKMLTGLLTTKDVLYFLVIIYIFLGLSIYKLKAGMESKPALVKNGRYALVVASGLAIGYVFSMPALTGYLDLTTNKSRTLAPNTQKIIKELSDDKLEVTTYVNLLDRFNSLGIPSARNTDLARWEPYIRFKNDIDVHYVMYYDSALGNSDRVDRYPGKSVQQIAQQTARSMKLDMNMFKTPEEIRKMIDLRPELNRYVMQLKYKDRTTFLRVFDDQIIWPGETEVSAAFKRLLQAKLPKIGFVTGDMERAIDKMGDKEYKVLTNTKTFRYSLINQGFDFDTISLDKRDVPADIATLVLADPRVSLSPVAVQRLKQYIDRGGNLLIAGEAGRQSILNPILQPLGVQLMEGQIVQQSEDFAPDLVTLNLTDAAVSYKKQLHLYRAENMPVVMPGVVGVSYNIGGAYTVTPLLLTDGKKSWNKKKKLDPDMVENADASGVDAPSSGNAQTGTITRPPVTAMHNASVNTTPHLVQGAPNANSGSTPRELSPEAKKRADSVRSVIHAIMAGPGTQDEKKQKMMDLMVTLRKQSMERAQANGTIHSGHVEPNANPGGTPRELSPEAKKRADSIRSVIHAIMAGPGTQDEKKQQMMELSATLRKQAMVHETKMMVPADKPLAKASLSRNVPTAQPANTDGTVSFSAADGDVRGPIATVVSLTRKVNGREQRIIVAGDADFMSNTELMRKNIPTANFMFNTGLFSWLSYGEFPIDTERPEDMDKRVTATTEGMDRLRLIFIWILPAILAAGATILLIRRKRQ